MNVSSDAGSLPSEIVGEYTSSREKGEKVDHEDILQRLLSALSRQPNLGTLAEDTTTLADSVWGFLNRCDAVFEHFNPGNPVYEWQRGLSFAGSLIHDLSPFELHSVASQSIIFAETTSTLYTTTCILLCCAALRNFPVQITSRPKRSRSCLFETVRLFQRHFTEVETRVSVPLWSRYVLPSCQHVIKALPMNTNDSVWYRSAFLAGAVFTSARIAAASCRTEVDKQAACFTETKFTTLECIRGMSDLLEGRYDLVWSHPWRTQPTLNNHEGRMDFEGVLAYWTKVDIASERDDKNENHEKVAHMETIWDDVGIAILAAVGFGTTRQVLWSPQYVWELWFPHVPILLNCDDGVTAQLFGFDLLKQLLEGTPQHSLTGSREGLPDFPIGTFQLLSNRILVNAVERQRGPSPASESLPDGSRTFQMMKTLLAKYSPLEQIDVVRLLLRDCPHDGLKPKLVDLLRSYVTWDHPEPLAKFWTFLGTFVKELQDQIDTEHEDDPRLKDPTFIVERAEVYVAILSLVQLWVLVKHCVPPDEDDLLNLLPNLQAAVRNVSRLNEEYHRLDLLDDAASRTADMMSDLERS